MKESEQKICKFPKCTEEVYDSNALFCGEHERIYRELSKKVSISASGLTMVALAHIVKKRK